MISPRVLGLVLAGGYSRRMGSDKAEKVYAASGKNQKQVVAQFMSECGLRAYVSCREEQSWGESNELWDAEKWRGLGPASGLLTAHERFPDAAWLVMAVDFPWATKQSLDQLLQSRDVTAFATAFENNSQMVEPLFALWEPAGLRALSHSPHSGARRVLETGPCRRVHANESRWLVNVNSPVSR